MFKRAIAVAIIGVSLMLPAAASQTHAHKENKSAKKVSPFLITKGLPHYTMILKKRWDDPKLALTAQQKKELLAIRKETIGSVMSLKPKILKLQKEITKAAMGGAEPQSLAQKVNELASLKAEATRTHLKCIYETRQVLTPKQLKYLNKILRHKRHKHK